MHTLRFALRSILIFAVPLACGLAACGGGSTPSTPLPPVPNPQASGAPLTVGSYPASFKEFTLPPGQSAGTSIVPGSDGAIWFSATSAIDSINGYGMITSHSTPQLEHYYTLAPAGDGALWFNGDFLTAHNFHETALGRLTTGGTFTLYPFGSVDEFFPSEIFPQLVKRAPGPGIVYTVCFAPACDSANLFSGGPPGSLGFGAAFLNYSSKAVTAGPDGNVYYVIEQAPPGNVFVVKLAPGHQAILAQFPLASDSDVGDMTTGPDGNLWILENGHNAIARMSSAGTGFVEFPVPTNNAGLRRIAAGPDGALYFTEYNASKIGRITTQGQISEYPTPTASSGPFGVTVCPNICEGAHARVWFTEMLANKVAQFEY